MNGLRNALVCLVVVVSAIGLHAEESLTPADLIQGLRPLQLPAEQISDLPLDKDVQWGRLENGLLYAIRQNDQPKGKVILRLYVQAGSLQETDSEQGLAHYLEHMAFNGSENFPPGTMVEQLQSSGIGFGNHLNAHTGFEETVYKLELPDTSSAILDLGFQVISDQAGRLLNKEEEVQREKGVILAEMRDRDGPSLRIWKQLYADIFSGLPYGQRFPIGIEETVQAANHERIHGYFTNWYRAERMVMVAVGDVDPGELETRIATYFADFPKHDQPVVQPDYGMWNATGKKALAIHEPESDGTVVRIVGLQANAWTPDNVADRQKGLLLSLGSSILSRRFARIAEEDTSTPFIDASASATSFYGLDAIYAGAQAKENRALEVVGILENEVRRFIQYGPTVAEVRVAVQNMKTALEQSVARQNTRSSAGLADAAYKAVRDAEALMSPEQVLALYTPWLEAARPGAIQKAWEERAQSTFTHISIAGRELLAENAESASAMVSAAFDEASKAVVVAPKVERIAQWAYDQIPAPAERLDVQDLEHNITVWRHANNVTCALLPRSEKPNEVLLQARIHLPYLSGAIGQRSLVSTAFQAGGLGKHDAREIREALASVQTRVSGPFFDENSAIFSASCTPEELPAALQQLTAWLTDPGWREQGAARAKARWMESLAAEATDIEASLNRAWNSALWSDHPVMRMPTMAEVEALELAPARAWFAPLLAEAPLEISVVGDVESEQAQALLAAYAAALPARQPVPVIHDLTAEDALPSLPITAEGVQSVSVQSSVRRTIMRWAWPTDDAGDVQFARRMGQLAAYLREVCRKRIREELGDAYSPYAVHRASTAFGGNGHLFVHVSVEPDRLADIQSLLTQEIQNILDNGIDPEVYSRVKEPVIQSLGPIAIPTDIGLGV